MSVLQTIDLKKYYGAEPNITRALDGVNISVEDGEFVAIVGTSGSGKSTLLHMMGGLDTPTSGTVIVRGEELAKKNDEQLTIFRRRNIGFIFQNYNLVPMLNVYENIVFSVKISLPLENTGVSSVFAASVWPFSLIFSLARRNEGNFFQAVPTTLSSSLAEVRLASLVAWA